MHLSNMHFFYDADGKPCQVNRGGTIYNYVLNVQGDVVGLTDASGNLVVEYKYDAWGKLLGISGSLATSLGTANPLRYRGYVYDNETGQYYLHSRYYDPETRRFISADETEIVMYSQPHTYNKNVYCYCDNNPIQRRDANGYYWLASVLIGLATQYVADVITNAVRGEKGIDIFKPSSSLGEYVAAGVTAIIPGSGLGSTLARNIVSEGIIIAEDILEGEDIKFGNSVINIVKDTIIDVGVDNLSNKTVKYIDEQMPKNYSSHAHSLKQKNKNITMKQIYKDMHTSIKTKQILSFATPIAYSIVQECVV